MIHAFLTYNHVSKTSSYRSYSPIKQDLLTTLIHALPSQPLIFESYILSYETFQGTLFCLLGDNRAENKRALSHILPVLSPDPIRSIMVANEVFIHGFNPIPHDILRNIISGESHEEILYENMIKNKQAEEYQRFKASKKQPHDKSHHVRLLEAEMRVEKKPVEVPKGKKVRVQPTGDFVITIREKISCVVDKENNVKECVANGDISVKINDAKYKHDEIAFKTTNDFKFSPNINKEKAASGILFSDRGYPLKRNVAVAKWKRECANPINFSLWASEEGECVVQLECESEMNDLIFEFSNKCRIASSTNVGDKVQLKVKNNEIVEVFCSRYEDMFPVEVDGWNNNVESVSVEEKEGVTIIKIFELEKYTIIF